MFSSVVLCVRTERTGRRRILLWQSVGHDTSAGDLIMEQAEPEILTRKRKVDRPEFVSLAFGNPGDGRVWFGSGEEKSLTVSLGSDVGPVHCDGYVGQKSVGEASQWT